GQPEVAAEPRIEPLEPDRQLRPQHLLELVLGRCDAAPLAGMVGAHEPQQDPGEQRRLADPVAGADADARGAGADVVEHLPLPGLERKHAYLASEGGPWGARKKPQASQALAPPGAAASLRAAAPPRARRR